MRFVDQHRDRFGVEPILRVLEIPTSTYYDWVARQRRPGPYQIEEVWLGEQIERIHKDSGETYGSPKVHAQLRREGIRCSRKRVERLMRQAGLQGAFLRKRRRSSTRRDPTATPAPDLVNRDFTAPAPNRLWVADLSRIPTGEGPLWLASVRDAFSRRVVGWKASDRADTQLVLGALDYALHSRQLEPDQLVFHSDHGAQYTAVRFTQRLADAGIAASMGTVGDSLDNALAENMFSTLKVERVHRTSYRTRQEAELDLIRFIDGAQAVVAAAAGRVDALANVAGIMDAFLPPAEVDDATWERVFAVNVTAVMRLTRAVLPMMLAAGGGAIVNVSSEASLRASASGVAYTASKHAVNGLTKSTAVFYKGQGIRANAVVPGPVATNIEAPFRSEHAAGVLGPIMQTTIPPVATAEQLAATITWLLSDDASNVNGAIVPCDGGWSAI